MFKNTLANGFNSNASYLKYFANFKSIITDRKTDRKRDRETERQKDRETERQRDRETESQRDRETLQVISPKKHCLTFLFLS
jgi:hypothetical protein